MSEQEKAAAEAVEKQAKEAAAEAAKKEGEETVVMTKAQVDELLIAAENATKLAEKKTSDAENYSKGMMKYKKLLKDNGIDDEEEKSQAISEERIAQIVKETIEKTIPTVTKPKEEDELTIANNKIAEMRLAITNSVRKTPSALGSNLGKEGDDQKTDAEKFFSPDQIADIKRKFPNADIEAIYKNLPKGDEMKGNNA